jgi:hypothetical protein
MNFEKGIQYTRNIIDLGIGTIVPHVAATFAADASTEAAAASLVNGNFVGLTYSLSWAAKFTDWDRSYNIFRIFHGENFVVRTFA